MRRDAILSRAMKRAIALLLIVAAIGCAKKSAPEKTYPMTATIVSHDVRGKTVNLRNKNIPGVMEAMEMDYPVRGANIESLPPDGTVVTATLHQREDEYWVTDIKPKK
jgi:copper binding protein CusF